MSRIRANEITNQNANGAPNFPNGITVTGVVTATTITQNINGDLTVSGTLTYEDVTNIDSVGVITARSTVSIADSIVHTGDTNTAIRFPSADTFSVETSGSERLRIGSAGQLGIGGTNFGTNTSTYNSNTGKSSQVLVSNGGSAAPTWAYTNRPAFMARQNQSSSQNIDTSTWTKVQLDEEILDTDNAYDNTTNYRFTVPTGGAGWYMCHFSTGIDDVQDSDFVYARLYLNGSGMAHAIGSGWCSAANAIIQATSSHMVYLDDGDYLELYVYHNEGSTEPTEQIRCYFGAFRLNI